MKKRLLPVLLILALIVAGTFYYRSRDEQKIGRQVDQLLENVAHQKISLRKPSDVREAVSEVLADEVQLYGAYPIPTATQSLDEVLEQIKTLHDFTTLCEIKVANREVEIRGDEAKATLQAEVLVAAGKNYQRREEWTMIFELKKFDVWKITGIKGIPPSNRAPDEEISF